MSSTERTHLSETRASGGVPLDRLEPERRTGMSIGRYRILEHLGSGGMGVVYAAYDPELDRKIAVKLLEPRGAGTLGAKEQLRLLAEARALAKLSHPNVVSVHDVGTHDGRVFVAMEFVDGVTLSDWLEAKPPLAEVLNVFVQAGEGLAAAHDAELVHRDFKPDNVMVGKDGRVRVMDFGLVRGIRATNDTSEIANDLVRDDTPVLRTLASAGTPAYMSPEQFLGEPSDARTDQFSFCIALYEAVFGRRPFSGKTIEQLAFAVTTEAPESVDREGHVPAQIRAAIVRGLATEPDDRWPNMHALIDVLRDDPGARRRRRIAWLAGITVVAGSVAAGVVATRAVPQVCAGVGEELTEVWNAETTARLASHFEADGKAAGTSWTYAERELEAWSEDWRAQRADACEAANLRGAESQEIYAQRNRCLALRRAELETVVGLLDEDPEARRKAVGLVGAMTAPSVCGDLEYLNASAKPPTDPERARRATELDTEAERVRKIAKAGRLDEAETRATKLVAEAEAFDHKPTLANAVYADGYLRTERGEYPKARAAYERAHYLALANGLDSTAIAAAHSLVFHTINYEGDLEAGQRWLDTADALITRIGDPAPDRFRHLLMHATLRDTQGRWEEAIELYRAALDQLDREQNDDPRRVSILNNMGAAYRMLEDHERSVATMQLALEETIRLYGESHPETGTARTSLGNILRMAGHPDQAFEQYHLAQEILEASLGADHPMTAANLFNEAATHADQGNLEAARGKFEAVSRVWETSYGPTHANTINAIQYAGDIRFDLGDLDGALEWYEKAVERADEGGGCTAQACAWPLLFMGRIHLLRDEPGEAVIRLRRAQALVGNDSQAEAYGEVAWTLGVALYRAGSESEGLAMVKQGRTRAEGLSPNDPELLAQIDRWLADPSLSPAATFGIPTEPAGETPTEVPAQ